MVSLIAAIGSNYLVLGIFKFNFYEGDQMRNLMKMEFGVLALLLAAGAAAQKPITYPAKGQSPQQQQKDDGECYVWAKTNTGIDPASPPASAPPPKPGGERVKGAVRGAIVGEAVDNNPGGGAAAGAVVGGAKARKNQAAQQQQAQSKQAQTMDTYYRAHGACMEGRGYTVK